MLDGIAIRSSLLGGASGLATSQSNIFALLQMFRLSFPARCCRIQAGLVWFICLAGSIILCHLKPSQKAIDFQHTLA